MKKREIRARARKLNIRACIHVKKRNLFIGINMSSADRRLDYSDWIVGSCSHRALPLDWRENCPRAPLLHSDVKLYPNAEKCRTSEIGTSSKP